MSLSWETKLAGDAHESGWGSPPQRKQKKLVNLIPPVLGNIWRLYGQVSCLSFPPYMTTKIRQKQNFIILCGIYLPWYVLYTSVLPEYTLFQFCPDISRQCWRNRTIWQTSIRFFSCQKWSKITRNTSVFLKQHRIDRFSPLKREKKLNWQSASQQKVQTHTPTKLFSKKCSNLTFWGFSNFQNWIFCHFWFLIKNIFFLNYKRTFVSPNFGLFGRRGGGWKNAIIYPPTSKKIPKSDFANIVVKRMKMT